MEESNRTESLLETWYSFDPHKPPVKEVQRRAEAHKDEAMCSRPPGRKGLILDLHLSGPQEDPGLPPPFSHWFERHRLSGLGHAISF